MAAATYETHARASTPGDALRALLEERGWSEDDLAVRLDQPTEWVTALLAGEARLTDTDAAALERVLGVPAGFWIEREARYRAQVPDRQTKKGAGGSAIPRRTYGVKLNAHTVSQVAVKRESVAPAARDQVRSTGRRKSADFLDGDWFFELVIMFLIVLVIDAIAKGGL